MPFCRFWILSAASLMLLISSSLWHSEPNRSATTFAQSSADSVTISGDLQQWHRVIVDLAGPTASETGTPNPFLDYRLTTTFTHTASGRRMVVPGFFAADGTAATSGATAGNVWRTFFAPPLTGTWAYTISFVRGTDIAVSTDPGTPVLPYDGLSGNFTVNASDKTGPDFRSPDKGTIVNVGNHYFTFAGSGNPWIKGGPNIPENLLGYDGFDNTPAASHSFAAHAADWQTGDPDWPSGDNPHAGRNLIGALNYIAGTGSNVVYFLPMNIGGDGQDTFPTISAQEKVRYDVSKLAQWEIVFAHAQSRGILLHVVLSETEVANTNYHDNGSLGTERRLFYRELVARFGHHPGLQWNLGEENRYSAEQNAAFAAAIKSIDPYDHPLTLHPNTNQFDELYGPHLGDANIDATSFQIDQRAFNDGGAIRSWRQQSATAGAPWAIAVDEPTDIKNDVADEQSGYPHGRTNWMWPVYLSGGAGFEWYVRQSDDSGLGTHTLDQQLDDFRIMDEALRWTGYALDFMHRLPLLAMEPAPDLARSDNGATTYVLAQPGQVYALYAENADALFLDLSGRNGTFDVLWFDPRNGGDLQIGTVATVSGGNEVALGMPPGAPTSDWAVLVRNTESRDDGSLPAELSERLYLPLIVTGGTAEPNPDPTPEPEPEPEPVPTCQDAQFAEQGGLAVIEVESQPLADGWLAQTAIDGFTGGSYYQWAGGNQSNNPGEGLLAYKIRIDTPGTYRFQWRSRIATGESNSESNDAWLRFPDAADFYGLKNAGQPDESIVYPRGSGKTPLPEGSGADGWFKIYQNNRTIWNWQANTSDNDAHQIFVEFDQPGIYTLQVSGRSEGFGIDRMVLYTSAVNTSTATDVTQPETRCTE